MGTNTFFLYARPGFLDGVARLIDFGGTQNIYNNFIDGATADRSMLSLDWHTVVAELRDAVRRVEAGEVKVS